MWVDAMRLRGSVHDLSLDRITEEEWKEYEKPTAGFFPGWRTYEVEPSR
jgi:hypothetical protein